MGIFNLFKKKGMNILVRIDFKQKYSLNELKNAFEGLKDIASQKYKKIEIVYYLSKNQKFIEKINLVCFEANFYDSDEECTYFENTLKNFLKKNKLKFDMHFTEPRSFEEETKYKVIKYATKVTKKDVDEFEKALKEGKVFHDVYLD